jgi:glycosyltransferase involved in cell wall biosynthesis
MTTPVVTPLRGRSGTLKILVVSPTPTHPQNAGNRARIFNLLRNLKKLGHEVHLFYLDREHSQSHVGATPDVEAMRQCWHGFTYAHDSPLSTGTLFDRLGLGRLRLRLEHHLTSTPTGRRRGKRGGVIRGNLWRLRKLTSPVTRNMWRVRKLTYPVTGNLWRLRNLTYPITGNLWRVIKFVNAVLLLPYRVRRLVAMVLRRWCPALFWKLKPFFPNKEGLPLDRWTHRGVATQAQAPDDSSDRDSRVSQIDQWYDFRVDRMVTKLHMQEQFDAIIVEYVFLSRVLTNFGSDVLKIIDTHDVFTNRHRQFEDVGLVETFFNTTRKEEAKGLGRADTIIAIQDQEQVVLQTLTDRRVVTVGHTVHVTAPARVTEVRKAVLYVGTGNAGNVHGVAWFIREVMPLIRDEFNDARLYLAGQVCAFVGEHENVVKLGEMRDLGPAYLDADVVINPAVVGTGLKIKSIEALGRGKALVSTPHAGSGLSDDGPKPYVEADGAREFANAIVNLFANAGLFNDLAANAYRFAERYNTATMTALDTLFCDDRQGQTGTDTGGELGAPRRAPKTRRLFPNFMIVAHPRTGSTTLAELLALYPDVSCLQEPFNPAQGEWGSKSYVEALNGGSPLHDVVRNIFAKYRGLKHLVNQLDVAQNQSLIRFPKSKLIYLWRRNHVQRLVSNEISMRAKHWQNDRSKIMVTRFRPLDLDSLTVSLAHAKDEVCRYRELCAAVGCFELAYEELFGSDLPVAAKLTKLDDLLDFLEVDRCDRNESETSRRVEQLLDPASRKLNSKFTYHLIPNIEEVEERLGSPENGFLFR